MAERNDLVGNGGGWRIKKDLGLYGDDEEGRRNGRDPICKGDMMMKDFWYGSDSGKKRKVREE